MPAPRPTLKVARLQAAQPGHGGSDSNVEIARSLADRYAFLLRQLGHRGFQSGAL